MLRLLLMPLIPCMELFKVVLELYDRIRGSVGVLDGVGAGLF
jgi:hypothetical protein